jgi:signal transduction histidine kinase
VTATVHAADDLTADANAGATRLERIRLWLPRGDSLSDGAFAQRHRTLSILLGLHLPVLIVFGIVRGYGAAHVVAEIGFAGLLLAIARLPATPRRLQGILVSAGLVWCSAVLVHFSGGVIEAHFHFFVILGFIALYQDWAAFGWAIVFTALSHGVGSTLAPTLMFNHEPAIQRPWTWALIHAGMVLFAAVGQIIGWRHAELAQHQATELNTELAREQASRQGSYSRIYVNLARRNQSLLHRQLAVIDQLEEHEEDPETLRKLFALDHLTTRVRRNAESLLVMAGEDSPRRWSAPVVLADVARAAAAEVEQYERAHVRVADPIAVSGGVVVDLTHLLAELVENAAEYSSPTSTVLVGGYATPDGAVVTVEDHGIGMSQADLDTANRTLADPPELDEEVVRHLGFQVVGRLARKLGLRVHLRPTVGGGITAVVEIPAAVLAGTEEEPAGDDDAPAAASLPAEVPPPPHLAVSVAPPPPASHDPGAPAAPVPAPVPAASAPLAPAAEPSPLLFSARRPPPATAIHAPRPQNGRDQLTEDADLFAEPVSPFAQQLPRRTPAASLAPELRDVTPSDVASAPPGYAAAPEARQALSAFQSAARAGRAGDAPPSQESPR